MPGRVSSKLFLSTLGSGARRGAEEPRDLADEVRLMAQLSREAQRPLTFTLFQVAEWPTRWKEVLEQVSAENAAGAQVFPQVGARPTGIVMSLRTYHPFMRRPSYLELKELSFEARLQALRDPARRAAILGEQSVPHPLPGTMENGVAFAELNFDQIFLFDEARDYEPTQEQSFAAQARAKGMDPHAFLYDALTAGSGERFAVMYFTNYADHNLDAVREMQLHPETVTGLSDAGAHVTVFSMRWPLPRADPLGPGSHPRGNLTLEHLVHRQTQRNAQLFGLRIAEPCSQVCARM